MREAVFFGRKDSLLSCMGLWHGGFKHRLSASVVRSILWQLLLGCSAQLSCGLVKQLRSTTTTYQSCGNRESQHIATNRVIESKADL